MTSSLDFLGAFQFYYTPILVNLGAIGNCLSIYIILKTKLKKLSSSWYLIALLISDTLFLQILQVVWLRMVDIDLLIYPFWCKGMIYLSSVCSCLSVWLVVAFTTERFIAVMYPLRLKFLCTVQQAKTIILILFVISTLIYVPNAVFPEVIPGINGTLNCNLDAWHKEAHIFNIFDTVLTFALPVIIIAALNTFISRNIWKFSHLRRRMTNSTRSQAVNPTEKAIISKKNSSHNLTKMLLIVSTVCLLMNLPSYIFRIAADLIKGEVIELPRKNQESFIFAQQCSMILFNTNFGINFVLYCISGQNFRKSVASVICGDSKCFREYSASSDIRTQTSSIGSSGKRRFTTFRVKTNESAV